MGCRLRCFRRAGKVDIKTVKKKTNPLKPSRTLATVVFPKKGKVYKNIEALPRTQKELELAIGQKFVKSLFHFHQIDLEEVRPIEAEGDLTTKRDDGKLITIQMTEVVDQGMRQIRDQRDSYRELLLTKHHDIADLFDGCRVSIVDSGTIPLLPKPNSKKGLQIVSDLAIELRRIGELISTLQVGKIRTRKIFLGPRNVELGIICERIVEKDQGLSSQFIWSGSYLINQDLRQNLIANVVLEKIKMGYIKPKGEFWLVIYSLDITPMPNDIEIIEATRRLQETIHPFDQVWFIYPYPNLDLGHIVNLWQH